MSKDKEIIIPAEKGERGICFGPYAPMITHFKPSDVLSLRVIRELPVILDSEGNMRLIKEVK